MKSLVIKLSALAIAAAASFGAHAVVAFDQNVMNNVIMGNGINNGGFTTDTAAGIEVGLRARERYDTVNNQPSSVTGNQGNGKYNQNAGEPPGFGSSNRARWNFDWSINTGTAAVGAYSYRLGMDYDAGLGTNYQTFNLINLNYADHSFGNNGTAQSAGAEAADASGYTALLAANNLVQNSWNYDFFDSANYPFDPTANGQYSIFLEVFSGDERLARSNIEVIVGTGAVPEPGSLALVGLALAGLAAAGRRKAR